MKTGHSGEPRQAAKRGKRAPAAPALHCTEPVDRAPRFVRIDDEARELAVEASGHKAVRIEHALLAAPLIVTAYRSPKRLKWKQAAKWAEKLDINGWSWRLPTVEEAFFIPDRSRYPAYDKAIFPDCEGEWIWTSTPDAECPSGPSGFAWGVFLTSGYSGRARQNYEYFVRAVRAGQF